MGFLLGFTLFTRRRWREDLMACGPREGESSVILEPKKAWQWVLIFGSIPMIVGLYLAGAFLATTSPETRFRRRGGGSWRSVPTHRYTVPISRRRCEQRHSPANSQAGARAPSSLTGGAAAVVVQPWAYSSPGWKWLPCVPTATPSTAWTRCSGSHAPPSRSRRARLHSSRPEAKPRVGMLAGRNCTGQDSAW